MRTPLITTMSGISVAVLGLSLHASQRPSPVAVGAAPAGLDQTPATATTHSAPATTHADNPRTAPMLASHSPTQRPASTITRAQASAHPLVGDPSANNEAGATAPTSSKTAVRASQRPTAKAAAPTVVVNGSPADTQYGPVQVQITLRGGRIIQADALDYPQSGGRDQEINSQAIPQLNRETVQANSAQIDTISGATYTSGGYRQSLQSALDAAHRAGAR